MPEVTDLYELSQLDRDGWKKKIKIQQENACNLRYFYVNILLNNKIYYVVKIVKATKN